MASAILGSREAAAPRMNFRSRVLCGVLAVAVVAVYSAIWPAAPFPKTDTTEYLDAARAIAAGTDTPQPRTPGFPLFLLAAGTGRPFFVISLGLHLAAVGLLAGVLWRLGASFKIRALFAVIAILPPFVQKDAFLLTEGLTEFLLVAAFSGLATARKSRLAAAWSGLALALAAITRPQNELLPLLIGGLLLVSLGWRRGWKNAVALILPALLLLGGLTVHNRTRFGYSGLTYLLGHHLGTRTVPLYEEIPDPQVRDVMVSTRNAAYPRRNPYWTTWYTRADLMRIKGLSPVHLAGYMEKIHLRLILTHPLAYLEEATRAFVHFWSPELPAQTNRSVVIHLISAVTQVLVCAAFWLSIILWAGLSMGRLFLAAPEWLPRGNARLLYGAAVAVVAYTAALSSALDIGEPRYRGPADLLILFVPLATAHFMAAARPARK
jgi:hypothetical protein